MTTVPCLSIAERNRRNSQFSTGPTTPEGKAISRCNSLHHGLLANPAAGVVEDPALFEKLLRELTERLAPQNPVEEGLVHRIAVCLWRLQRAAKIDAAVSGLSVASAVPWREEVQGWIERINDGWRLKVVWETDPAVLSELKEKGLPRWFARHCKRSMLHRLDDLRECEIMQSGPAITAMIVMIGDLVGRLEQHPRGLGSSENAEKLGWLLGDFAQRLPEDSDEVTYPDQAGWASPIDALIGQARQREKGQPLPKALEMAVENRLTTLRQQRQFCDEPYTAEQWEQKRTAALLPDAATLDRLIRYEGHSERSLHRSLETLAKLRGATVETVLARISGQSPDGTRVEFQRQQTQWTPPDALAEG